MTHAAEVARTVLPVAVMLIIGMVCRARDILNRSGIDALKNVAVNIALPAVLLKAFATTKYTLMDVLVPALQIEPPRGQAEKTPAEEEEERPLHQRLFSRAEEPVNMPQTPAPQGLITVE